RDLHSFPTRRSSDLQRYTPRLAVGQRHTQRCCHADNGVNAGGESVDGRPDNTQHRATEPGTCNLGHAHSNAEDTPDTEANSDAALPAATTVLPLSAARPPGARASPVSAPARRSR